MCSVGSPTPVASSPFSLAASSIIAIRAFTKPLTHSSHPPNRLSKTHREQRHLSSFIPARSARPCSPPPHAAAHVPPFRLVSPYLASKPTYLVIGQNRFRNAHYYIEAIIAMPINTLPTYQQGTHVRIHVIETMHTFPQDNRLHHPLSEIDTTSNNTSKGIPA